MTHTLSEFDSQFIRAAVDRKYFRLNRLAWRGHIRNARAHFESLVGRGLVAPEDTDAGYAGIEWRNRMGRRVGYLILPVACALVFWDFESGGIWRVLSLTGSSAAGMGLYFNWYNRTDPGSSSRESSAAAKKREVP